VAYLDPGIQGPAVAFIMGEAPETSPGLLQVDSHNFLIRNWPRIVSGLGSLALADKLEDNDFDLFGYVGSKDNPPVVSTPLLASTVPGQNTVSARDGGKIRIQDAGRIDHIEAIGLGSEVTVDHFVGE
jgi:hypothetical protein